MSEHIFGQQPLSCSRTVLEGLFLCDSVSHVSVRWDAVSLFPFHTGRPDITQSKADRQALSAGRRSSKHFGSLRGSKTPAICSHFLTFWALHSFTFLLCVLHWKSILSSLGFLKLQIVVLYHLLPIWTILSLFLFFFPPSLSLSQTSCAVPCSPEAASLTSQRNASQEVVLSAVCAHARVCVRWRGKETLDMCLHDDFTQFCWIPTYRHLPLQKSCVCFVHSVPKMMAGTKMDT